jgi:hypothetical protein
MSEIEPSVLANSIMGKLYDVLTNGDDTVPKSEDNFFSWATPGIPMQPEDFKFLSQGFTGIAKTQLDAAGNPIKYTDAQLAQLKAADVTGLFQQAEFLARLVDFVPDVTVVNNEHFSTLSVMNNQGTLSEIYERTLQFSEVKNSELTQAQKDKLEELRAKLVTVKKEKDIITDEEVEVTSPSPLVKLYNTKMAAYVDAGLEYNQRRIDAMNAATPEAVQYYAVNASLLRNKVKAAWNDWVTTGHKEDYEKIAAFIQQMEGRDLVLLKQRYLDDLEKARLTGIASGSEFFSTSLIPASFATSAGWSRFTFSAGELNTYSSTTFDKSGWSASAAGSWMGIFNAAGSATSEHSKDSYTGKMDSAYCNMTFEIAQVPIVRPWLKTSYLTSTTWKFDPTNPDVANSLLSDGKKPPKGQLVAYPTTAIFIRKLRLDFGQNSSFTSWLQEKQSSNAEAGGYVALGPLVLGGGGGSHSASGSTQNNAGYKYDDHSISVDGMQLIGFKCHILPKAPNPDPSITVWV